MVKPWENEVVRAGNCWATFPGPCGLRCNWFTWNWSPGSIDSMSLISLESTQYLPRCHGSGQALLCSQLYHCSCFWLDFPPCFLFPFHLAFSQLPEWFFYLWVWLFVVKSLMAPTLPKGENQNPSIRAWQWKPFTASPQPASTSSPCSYALPREPLSYQLFPNYTT